MVPTTAFPWPQSAEDAGFEPARACTQPAFQVCPRRVRQCSNHAVRRPSQRWQLIMNPDERLQNETKTETGNDTRVTATLRLWPIVSALVCLGARWQRAEDGSSRGRGLFVTGRKACKGRSCVSESQLHRTLSWQAGSRPSRDGRSRRVGALPHDRCSLDRAKSPSEGRGTSHHALWRWQTIDASIRVCRRSCAATVAPLIHPHFDAAECTKTVPERE